MKKLVLSLAVVFAVGMVSCGGNKDAEATEETPVEEVAVEETTETVPCDSVACDSVAETPAETPAAE